MFTKIYFTIAIVLRCNKKCSNFLWYFDGNSVVSLISRQKLCVLVSVVSFQLVEFANWNWNILLIGTENVRLVVAGKYFTEYFFSFFMLEKIKCRSNLAASSDFTVTSRRVVIYTVNWTFPVAIMSGLRSLFWLFFLVCRPLQLKYVSSLVLHSKKLDNFKL